MPDDEYGAFAADYHWLLDDEQLTGRPFIEPYRSAVAALPTRARILDAACGIGVEAFELARRGFAVTATDGSEAMVAAAVAGRPAGLAVELDVCRWGRLPDRFTEPFDLVVCNGNSLVHANGAPGGLVEALRGLAAVVSAGGRLVVGTRDFEHLRDRRPEVEVAPTTVVRDGVEAVRFYSWTIPERWEEPHVASVHLALLDAGAVDHRRYDVSFRPFRWPELAAAIAEAGLVIETSTRTGDADRYTLILTRADGG